MITLHDPVRFYIAKKISNITSADQAIIYQALTFPPNPEMGDLAFGCFQLASKNQTPAQIAKEICARWEPCELIEKAQAMGPYVNFVLKTKGLGELVINQIITGKYFQIPLTQKTPKTMIEYSQPNTHKELHVGHMRNLALGHALVRILRYANYDIVTSTFPGDMGTHVAKCLWYLKYHNTEPVPQTHRGQWLGKLYSKGHLKLEDEEGTPNDAKNKSELTLILKQLESQSGEFYDLWKETRQWSIDLMKSVYAWAGVEFDHWYWESEVDQASVQLVQRYYQEGKLIKSDGAIGLDLSHENLGFVLLLKSDGTGLYATKDLELARRKFEDHKIERSVYVVDMRQALHFKQVFRTLEILGFPQAKQCFHLQYNFVELPDGAMSSRKGNIVPIMELIEQMQETIKSQYLNRYKNEWTAEEIQHTAEQVAKGAIFYGMTRIDNNKKIVFDMKEWLKLDGESGPFIQYSYARIASLCRKLGFSQSTSIQWGCLTEKSEKSLIFFLSQFNTYVTHSAENLKPAILCGYLYDLAKKFNLFYHECPIGQAPSPDLKTARLALSYATGQVLKQGLALLGIPAPEKM